jgi:hypothetical protein
MSKSDTEHLTAAVLADLEQNVRELPEIDEQNFDAFYDLAVRSLVRVGDMYSFSIAIMNLNIAGMTGPRASRIAMDITFRAKEMIDRERQAALGITKAKWRYGNAPCMLDAGNPTPADIKRNARHKAANGKRYVIAEGLMIDGKPSWPGRESGCKCSSGPIIPGFGD